MLKIFQRIVATTFLLMVLVSPLMATETWPRWLKFEKSFFKDEMVLNCGQNSDYKITKFFGIKNVHSLLVDEWYKEDAKFTDVSVKMDYGNLPPNLGLLLFEEFNTSQNELADIAKIFLPFLPIAARNKVLAADNENFEFWNIFDKYFQLDIKAKRTTTINLRRSYLSTSIEPKEIHLEFWFKKEAVNKDGLDKFKSAEKYALGTWGNSCTLTK